MFNPKLFDPALMNLEQEIAELKHLDYKSENVQQKVFKIFQLDCGKKRKDITEASRKDFADFYLSQIIIMHDLYWDLFGEEASTFIMDAVHYFGETA